MFYNSKGFYSIQVLFFFVFLFSCNDEVDKGPIQLPLITTNTVLNITKTSAICGGFIPDSIDLKIIVRGVCWSELQNPTLTDGKTVSGNGSGKFTSKIVGLKENTTYYVRSYATNKLGTTYGVECKFTTASVEDVEGNGYHTVVVGKQEWLVENLKTTKFNDGVSILNYTNIAQWANSITPGFGWYNNDSTYKDIYGALYNWDAVNTGKLAPKGWHVATKYEWDTLVEYTKNNLGYSVTLAKALASDKYWNVSTEYTGSIGNDLIKNNSSGFFAVGGGLVDFLNNNYANLNSYGYWWTSTELDVTHAYFNRLSNRFANIDTYETMMIIFNPKVSGMSVRCIKDSK